MSFDVSNLFFKMVNGSGLRVSKHIYALPDITGVWTSISARDVGMSICRKQGITNREFLQTPPLKNCLIPGYVHGVERRRRIL